MIDVILLTGALFAAQAPATASAAPAAASTDNRRVCRVISQVGSRLGSRRVCGTQAEWDDVDSEARRTMAEGRQRMLAPTVDGSIADFERMSRRCARC
jgi:hypothetical protein